MLRSGLVSVTFRKLEPGDVVALAVKAKVEGIEWGGDVHVPHGDVGLARQVSSMTKDAGLEVAAYGSYYRAAESEEEELTFESVLETAVALKAPIIRVWAGRRGSAQADARYRERVVNVSRRIADMAAKANVAIAYEFHGNTLTDTNESTLRLLREVAHDNVKTYWQRPQGASAAQCVEGLKMIAPWLTNVHVNYRDPKSKERRLIAGSADVWQACLEEIGATGRDHFLMIEFVKDEDPKAFMKDAKTLKGWLEGR